jgi:hypothetical protein
MESTGEPLDGNQRKNLTNILVHEYKNDPLANPRDSILIRTEDLQERKRQQFESNQRIIDAIASRLSSRQGKILRDILKRRSEGGNLFQQVPAQYE